MSHNTPDFGGPAALNGPVASVVDAEGHLYVVDQGNNRVLGYTSAPAFRNGAQADIVIGEPDFYSQFPPGVLPAASDLNNPMSVAADPGGNLYVSDFGNNRVLEYDAPFLSGYVAGQPANRVLGQKDLTTVGPPTNFCQSTQTPSADDLCGPTGLASDAQGNVYVTDSGYNRVLIYLNPTTPSGGTPGKPGSAGDATADVVFGQNNSFTAAIGCYSDTGPPISASTLCIPWNLVGGLAVSPTGDLFVADAYNARVLRFNSPLGPGNSEPGAGDTTADLVIGQRNFDSALQCSRHRRSNASVLCYPQGVSVDPSGNLYVADATRVLEFNASSLHGTPKADRVYGQKSFTADSCGPPTAKDLCTPMLPATDSAGALYVPDWINNRVMAYDAPLSSPMATRELGQVDFTHSAMNFPTARSIQYPGAVTTDQAGHLYVADYTRVLGWQNATGFANGQPADLIIGQPDFYDTKCHYLYRLVSGLESRPPPPESVSDHKFVCSPGGMATDGSGNLFVSDSPNNRVLMYADPFAACGGVFPCVGQAPKVLVAGAAKCKPGPDTVCDPEQLAIDKQGNLWVADYGNSRVLLFDHGALSGVAIGKHPRAVAALVIGQGPSGDEFRSSKCDQGDPSNPTATADTVCYPTGVAVDRLGNVYVSDQGNSRVLEYDNPLALTPGTPGQPGSAGDVTADLALESGANFVRGDCSDRTQVCSPGQLAIDSQGNVYVTDDSRVIEFFDPTVPSGGMPGQHGYSGDTTSDAIFGQQGNFSGDFCNGGNDSTIINATTLCRPNGVAVDLAGDAYIADTMNNRVLFFSYASTPAATSAP